MPRSRITAKYQVTIPKKVRDEVGVKAGEEVSVEAVSKEKILLKRFPHVTDPLKVLIGRKLYPRAVSVEELETSIESR